LADFADNLRELLKRRRMSQRQLADLIGLSQAMVSRWVEGKNMPKFLMVAKLADVFNVPIEMFVSSDLADVTDGEIEQRRNLSRAIEMVGVEESLRRILVAGSKPVEHVSLDVRDETSPKKIGKGRRGAG
jgi:transcriptional regulator with XRE-family HTH domain